MPQRLPNLYFNSMSFNTTLMKCRPLKASSRTASLNKIIKRQNCLKILGVKISPQNVNLVYTGSLDQTIKLWDLRNGSSLKPVLTFAEEKTTGHKKEKPLTTFDVNCSDMFIAAGTEQVCCNYNNYKGKAFILCVKTIIISSFKFETKKVLNLTVLINFDHHNCFTRS